MLPGWQAERVEAQSGEHVRKVVYDPSGAVAGEILYIHRRGVKDCSYGWVPAHRRGARLMTQVEACRALRSRDLVSA